MHATRWSTALLPGCQGSIFTRGSQEVFSFVLRKKWSKTKKRMKEEEIEKGNCGPPTRAVIHLCNALFIPCQLPVFVICWRNCRRWTLSKPKNYEGSCTSLKMREQFRISRWNGPTLSAVRIRSLSLPFKSYQSFGVFTTFQSHGKEFPPHRENKEKKRRKQTSLAWLCSGKKKFEQYCRLKKWRVRRGQRVMRECINVTS